MSQLTPEREADNSAEVEITPEMIEAGCAVLDDYEARFEADFEIMARLYSAMAAAGVSSRHKTDRPNRRDDM